ncbi:CPBP family intramembrane glutamic endopeptidase [Sporanaerobacter sp. PP17-6a]|uniref:CPBP family intramembrane glutamic endopeptidase n=1 Tax=Sporanaerobacter sp. PP17-6a TaxID=1891289 RepID=UPI0008A033F5|nr:CPBP family intramembrane glutamic endopeptidase [Sporanaerobacter sp. PP17-6a]SCL92882.1 CAAX amino terminal protease self-immunity [Sporanaerobacter sp. PP17-6a]
MGKKRTQATFGIILLIYLICFVFRGIEYMFIRTDQSIFGEAFIHKLMGIGILFIALKYLHIRASEIGFQPQKALKNVLYGLLLGVCAYTLAYGIEYSIHSMLGNSPSLQLYVTSYSVNGNLGNQTGLLFFAICIIGNIINVVMEEGVFRGLFLKLAEKKYSFLIAVILSSVLFGFWHIAAPLRSFLNAERSFGGTLMMMLMLVVTTGITGVKFCLLTKISGSLWLPMADHFLNNTIINILHISTITGVDELQIVRITISQTVSFIAVLLIFCKNKFYKRETFR